MDKTFKEEEDPRRRRKEEDWDREKERNPPKTGPWTPPGVQTDQFFAAGAAVATRRAPEGQEAANPDPRGSNFEVCVARI